MNYSLRRACRIVRLSPSVVASLVDAGVVTPARGPRGALEFSFRDLSVLRAVAGAPAAALKRGAVRLRPAEGHRLVARGARPVVVERDGTAWDAETGQLLMDLDGAPPTRPAHVHVIRAEGEGPAGALLDEAIALEADDPDAAVLAYQQAIAAAPEREDAYLNLGALLEERGGLELALQVYLDGMRGCPRSALLRFNAGVAWQLQSAWAEAERCYHEALALDPALADAHHNLAIIYIATGEEQRAIRHHNALRRLERS